MNGLAEREVRYIAPGQERGELGGRERGARCFPSLLATPFTLITGHKTEVSMGSVGHF